MSLLICILERNSSGSVRFEIEGHADPGKRLVSYAYSGMLFNMGSIDIVDKSDGNQMKFDSGFMFKVLALV